MIVDRVGSMRETLARHLGREGFVVETLGGAAEVGARLRGQPLDAVVLALAGLGREGLRSLRLVRDAGPEIPVILINHPEAVELSIAGMKLGAVDEVLIPFELSELVVRLRRACRIRGRRMLDGFRRAATAIAYAEAGDFDTARSLMDAGAGGGSGGLGGVTEPEPVE